MKRRNFLRTTALGTTAGLLLPAWLSGCKKDKLANFPEGFKILIVGAGAAGLYAAKKMKEHGAQVQILEASGVIGGRIRKTESFADFPIDLGAEWIHGKKSLSHKLAKDAGVQFYSDESDNGYLLNGSLQPSISNAQLEQIRAILEGEQTYSGADISVLQYAQQQGVAPSLFPMLEYISGEFGTSAERLSILNTPREAANWSSGSGDFKFKKTYFDLLRDVVAPTVINDVIFNAPVAQIDYAGSAVVATTENGDTYTADRILVTASVAVLKSGSIAFSPQLSQAKQTAIQNIGMDAGMKICMKFSQDFWSGNNVIGTELSPSYISSGYGKDGSDNVLTAFVMGNKAAHLSSLGNGAVQALITELDALYNGQASASLVDSLIMDWKQEPYIQGAYSYSTIGIGNSREILAQNVDGKAFFAGEATALNGHFQTVQGAMESGEREFESMLESV